MTEQFWQKNEWKNKLTNCENRLFHYLLSFPFHPQEFLYIRIGLNTRIYITSQNKLLEDYANHNDFSNIVHISDDGYSGTNFDRPDWKRLIAEAEAGK